MDDFKDGCGMNVNELKTIKNTIPAVIVFLI